MDKRAQYSHVGGQNCYGKERTGSELGNNETWKERIVMGYENTETESGNTAM